MTKRCKFCRQGEVRRIFSATKLGKEKTPPEFTCTNCGFGVHGPIIKCKNCGMIYVDEAIPQKKISTYYEISEDTMYFSEQESRRKTFGHYLKRLERLTHHKGKLLDVGTNTGLFVKLAKDNGWEAIGLEPNQKAANYAKSNYGVDLVQKSFAPGVFPRSSFDVITMWDVIEHFTNPLKQIKNVFSYLKPGGVFALTTVDPESPLAKAMGSRWPWYMEMHRIFFSQTTLRRYLQEGGFSRIKFYPHTRYLSAGYLATRLVAIHPGLSQVALFVSRLLNFSNKSVLYYANDLYDCYAFKK